MGRKRKELIAEPNLTPLCDAAMTLIIVFIMTLPSVIWSGFKVDSTQTRKSGERIEKVDKEPSFVAISITKDGVYFNGVKTTEQKLFKQIGSWSEKMKKRNEGRLPEEKEPRMAVILPDDDVPVDFVVRVFDIAKLAGTEKFALLKPGK